MELPERKHPRLNGYDYSQNGAYFVTICTHQRKNLLSTIDVGRGLAPAAHIQLTQYGKIAEEQLLDLERRYPTVQIDQYVIMPNHVHAIIRMEDDAAGASPRPTLSDVVCAYKSITTRLCNQICRLPKLFQTSFYEHIIRNETDWREIWEYIEKNPAKWAEDRYCKDCVGDGGTKAPPYMK